VLRVVGLVIVIWCSGLNVKCLLYGVWCMVYGVWCLVIGVWCLVFGVWCLVFGVWFLCLVLNVEWHRCTVQGYDSVSFI
jgi:hypothetical protein